MIRKTLVAALAAAALLAPVAQAAPDKPVPCGKASATDAKGDAFVGFVGLAETPLPAGPNTDFTQLFFRRDGDRLTVNASVANLDKTVPPDATSIGWRVYFDTSDAVTHYVQISLAAGAAAPTSTFGHTDTSGNVKDGDTKAAFFEGPDGVIQADIPPAALKPGAKISNVYMFSAYVRGVVNTQTDQVPDGSTRAVWSGAPCDATANPNPQPLPGPPVTPPPGGTPPLQPKPGSGSGAATGPLQITVNPTALKAKKLKKAKKLSFSLKSSESLTNVVATFKKASKALGTGTLAKLAGPGKLAVKLKKKGLKKGSYSLVLTGKRADGSSGTLKVKISVK